MLVSIRQRGDHGGKGMCWAVAILGEAAACRPALMVEKTEWQKDVLVPQGNALCKWTNKENTRSRKGICFSWMPLTVKIWKDWRALPGFQPNTPLRAFLSLVMRDLGKFILESKTGGEGERDRVRRAHAYYIYILEYFILCWKVKGVWRYMHIWRCLKSLAYLKVYFKQLLGDVALHMVPALLIT